MPPEAFSIFWLLKKEGIDGAFDEANQMRGVLERFPHWRRSEGHEREVKQKLCGILLQRGIDTSGVTKMVQKIMKVIKGGVK